MTATERAVLRRILALHASGMLATVAGAARDHANLMLRIAERKAVPRV